MRINEFYKYMLFLSLLSCNMSDYNEEIINGYQYNFESSDKCLNSIIYDEKIDTIKAKGYIINTETYLKIGPLSRKKINYIGEN